MKMLNDVIAVYQDTFFINLIANPDLYFSSLKCFLL